MSVGLFVRQRLARKCNVLAAFYSSRTSLINSSLQADINICGEFFARMFPVQACCGDDGIGGCKIDMEVKVQVNIKGSKAGDDTWERCHRHEE